ncbi:kinase domain protein [Onchocerca flexuosa]|uniref:Kinase domain protein n=1 Tax=Onchocerca flexuosa TaxID=387005 RepID=A0A238BMU5_9BILA|nr:kinase domain protein [Onchocerca flexuosa]
MTMIMDINGTDLLQTNSTAANFPSAKTSFHDYEASTSNNLHETDNDIYAANTRAGELSQTSCISMCPDEFEAEQKNDELCWNCNIVDQDACQHSRLAPRRSSCVFLEMALKRLYARDDFDVLESLGEGFFGDVYKVQHRYTGEIMVLKVGKGRGRDRIRIKANVLKEVDVLNQLTSHPNLLAFRGVCVDLTEKSWNLHILMDFCDAGSLSRLICDHQKYFEWSLRCSLARDISYAMDFVHSKGIMHRDLTSMNVLLQKVANRSLKAVVADFGLSCKIPQIVEKLTQVGTPFWMAPECLKEDFYDEKADVFSFGIILCQMIARIDADPEAGLYRTHNFGLDYVRFTAHCPTDTPLDILNLAFQCCLMDPAARPSFMSICDFFTNFRLSRYKDYSDHSSWLVESDGRLERSLSDATSKYWKSKQSELFSHVMIRKEQSSRNQRSMNTKIPLLVLQEGVLHEDLNHTSKDEEMKNKSRMEELARSVAVDELSDEVSLDTGNPFISHEIYKTTRKLAFPETNNQKKCVILGVKESDDSSINATNFDSSFVDYSVFSTHINEQTVSIKKYNHRRRISKIHRSVSFPSSSTNKSWIRPCATFDPLLPSSSSTDLTFGQRGKTDHIGEHCVLKGQMSMAFKNKDRKFTSRQCSSTFSNGTLLSLSSMENQRVKNFSLSADEEILNRDISELTFERWKSDNNFANSVQQNNDVVIQQPFPVGLSAVKYSTVTSKNEFSNGTQCLWKVDYNKCHVQVIHDTVVHKEPVHNRATTSKPFCVTGPKCVSYNKHADDRCVPISGEYCVIL